MKILTDGILGPFIGESHMHGVLVRYINEKAQNILSGTYHYKTPPFVYQNIWSALPNCLFSTRPGSSLGLMCFQARLSGFQRINSDLPVRGLRGKARLWLHHLYY